MSFSDALIYNPANPHVFNENYFQNTSHVIYKDTTSYFVFRTSTVLCTILSSCSIGFLLYLVAFKTPKYFKSYSRILLIFIFGDVYVICANFICRAVGLDILRNVVVLAIPNLSPSRVVQSQRPFRVVSRLSNSVLYIRLVHNFPFLPHFYL